LTLTLASCVHSGNFRRRVYDVVTCGRALGVLASTRNRL